MIKYSKTFYFFFVLFLCSVQFSGQNIVITYAVDNKDYIEDFKKSFNTNSDPTTKKLAEFSIKAQIESQNSTYTLVVNNNLSYFYLNELMLNEANGENLNAMIKILAHKGEYYQDSKTKKIIQKTSDNQHLIEYGFDLFQWELTSETKEIAGFTCYKAMTYYEDKHPMTGKPLPRNITVWYSPDLSANFGPQGYGGLPGLILEKCQSGSCFTATKIIQKEVKIVLPTGKFISRESYQSDLQKVNLGF